MNTSRLRSAIGLFGLCYASMWAPCTWAVDVAPVRCDIPNRVWGSPRQLAQLWALPELQACWSHLARAKHWRIGHGLDESSEVYASEWQDWLLVLGVEPTAISLQPDAQASHLWLEVDVAEPSP